MADIKFQRVLLHVRAKGQPLLVRRGRIWIIILGGVCFKRKSAEHPQKDAPHDQSFEQLKAAVKACYDATLDDGVEMRFCHCDTYAPNWMLTEDQTILIDWEYAGNADPGCDLGTYIMDSMWEVPEAELFIKEYCGEEYNEKTNFHYLAYVAILSYYWYVWALYREACGAVMSESLYNWYIMAKRYSKYLVEKYGLRLR